MKNFILLISFIVCVSIVSDAQTSYEDFKKKSSQDIESFRDISKKNYESFRKKANDDYANFLKKSWKNYNALKSPINEDKTPSPPIIYDNNPIKDESKPIKKVIPPPTPSPQPSPIEPIKEIPEEDKWLSFRFYGANLKVRIDNRHKFYIGTLSKQNISTAWSSLSSNRYNNVINDCLNIRKKHNLCDWAYLLMIKKLSESFAGEGSNEATLLMAYIYCQSGYKMKLAYEGNQLYMLYASKHHIYNLKYFYVDGANFYPLGFNGNSLNICQASFPNEQALSLYIFNLPNIGEANSKYRDLQSNRYKSANATISINSNLIDFYNTYPTSEIDNNFMTRWAMYANAPLSDEAKNTLYPAMRLAIDGVSQLEAANRILNFVQTAFDYEYDNKVWGEDRAFFADETLFYPYSDCEDRSILFSRLIRDLLGLDVVLVYYPGHLATAVHFTTDVRGDNFTYDGKKFVICDPTYINALVGATMPQFRGCRDISVILLDK